MGNLRARHLGVFYCCNICEEPRVSVQHAFHGFHLSRVTWLQLKNDFSSTDFTTLMNCSWLEFFQS